MKLSIILLVILTLLIFITAAQSEPTKNQPQNIDLVEKSSIPTKQEGDKALNSAHALWKNNEYDSVMMAFKDGPLSDPVNPAGNIYYADCLERNKDLKAVDEYMKQAIVFGEGTPEGNRVRTALNTLLAKLQEENEREDLILSCDKYFIGKWITHGKSGTNVQIEILSVKNHVIEGEVAKCDGWGWRLDSGRIDGDNVTLNLAHLSGATFKYTLKLISKNEMVGNTTSTKTYYDNMNSRFRKEE
jgi:hypothetical protein